MRFLTIVSALLVWALASPAALAEACRDMGGAAEPATTEAHSIPDAGSGTCCSAGSGCGVCCLAPTPYAPEPVPAGVTPGVSAAVLVAVALRQPAGDRVSRRTAPGDELPQPPERPGVSGPRGPPSC